MKEEEEEGGGGDGVGGVGVLSKYPASRARVPCLLCAPLRGALACDG